jgi:hypothetical protein
MRLHPTFYVGRLKRYHRFVSSSSSELPSRHHGLEGELEYNGDLSLTSPTSAQYQCAEPSASRTDPGALIEDTSPLRAPSAADKCQDKHILTQAEKEKDKVQDRSLSSPKDSIEKTKGLPPFVIQDEMMQGQLPSASTHNGDKPLRERNDQTEDRILPPPPSPLIDNQGNTMWIVESIVTHRHVGKRPCARNREFLVHWLGYPPSSRTWEPRKNLLKDIPDFVREYEKTHGL